MSATFYTPAPVTLGGIHFVFYFVPQFVADTFDNIPQFYVDVIEKVEPDNQQRMYITCKPQDSLNALDPDQLEEATQATVQEFCAYMKKCFDKVLTVVETMPSSDGAGIVTIEAMIRCMYRQKRMLDIGAIVDYVVVHRFANNNKLMRVDVSPGLLSPYDFRFHHVDISGAYPNYAAKGKCTLMGEVVHFVVDPTIVVQMEIDTVRRFISPLLVEDMVNATIRKAFGIPNDTRTYIDNVELKLEI